MHRIARLRRGIALIAVVITCVIVTVAPVASAAPETPGQPSASAPALWDCTKPALQPKHFSIWCFHASLWTRGVTWSTWTPTRAVGTGDFVVNTCQIDCADGPFVPYRAVFTYDRPKQIRGRDLYTRMRVRFTAAVPDRFDRTGNAMRLAWGYTGECTLVWVDVAGSNPNPCSP